MPRALPALVEAQQITSRAAGVGFDWENAEQVLDKLHEEIAEFAEAREPASRTRSKTKSAICCSSLVNLARFVKVDPEQALRRTNAKFRQRFAHVERRPRRAGQTSTGTPIEEMEALWQEAKSDSRLDT